MVKPTQRSHSDIAWDRLRQLAQLLRDRQQIPIELADFVADAIEASEGKELEPKKKLKALGDELGLTANNRQKVSLSAADVRVIQDFDINDDGPASQTETAKVIAARFGISESTVVNRVREADAQTREDIEYLQSLGDPDDWTEV